jgi:hypothetical protein
MYGKYTSLVMDPPHILIFSNLKCPRETLSDYRWQVFELRIVEIHKFDYLIEPIK